ncbi:MAG: TIR domain-containing protein [Vicinamibacterales bacterium]
MSHLFISYATDDQAIAQDVCALLEAQGVQCWIAPRDVAAGKVWDEAILDAIEGAAAFLLILSKSANASAFVKNEVNRAFSLNRPIVTFRVEDVLPGRSLELYLARHHWTDGFTGRIEDQAAQLAASVRALMGASAADAAGGVTAGTPPKAAGKTASKARLVTRASRRERVAWTAAGAAMVVALISIGLTRFAGAPPDTRVYKLTVLPPPGVRFPSGNVPRPAGRFALSPGGTRLVFVGVDEGSERRQLYVRALDSETAQPLTGTEGAMAPFWSPDSRFIGFLAEGKLKTIDANGGSPAILAATGAFSGGAWNATGVVLFSPRAGSGGILHRIAATGGPTTPATTLPGGSVSVTSWPTFLPDGRHFLFTETSGSVRGIYAGTLDTKEQTRVLPVVSNAAYAHGFLFFLRGQALMAQPFDADRLETAGEAVQVGADVATGGSSGAVGPFSVSDAGVLAFQTGGAGLNQLTWRDRAGTKLGTLGRAALWNSPSLSPDGLRVVAADGPTGRSDFWVLDTRREVQTRLTLGANHGITGVWSPDGSRILFESFHGDDGDLYQQPSTGVGAEEALFKAPLRQSPMAWSPDGRFVLYMQDQGGESDMWVLPMFGDRKPAPYVVAPGVQGGPAFSSDGRWVAYASDESGRTEVYVTPFPRADRKWQVSSAGGRGPRWRHDGKEIFFTALDSTLMAAAVSGGGAAFEVAGTTALFTVKVPSANARVFDVSADGQRFLITEGAADPLASGPITVIVNWPALLKKKP